MGGQGDRSWLRSKNQEIKCNLITTFWDLDVQKVWRIPCFRMVKMVARKYKEERFRMIWTRSVLTTSLSTPFSKKEKRERRKWVPPRCGLRVTKGWWDDFGLAVYIFPLTTLPSAADLDLGEVLTQGKGGWEARLILRKLEHRMDRICWLDVNIASIHKIMQCSNRNSCAS